VTHLFTIQTLREHREYDNIKSNDDCCNLDHYFHWFPLSIYVISLAIYFHTVYFFLHFIFL